MKHIRHSITCLFDLPDEILLIICRYLSPYDVLYAFYTPSEPEQRLHRMILDHRTRIKIDEIQKNEYDHLFKLFSHSETPLRPKSLILNNEHVTCLTYYYFSYTPEDVIRSMFSNLKCLTLIDCLQEDLQYLNKYIENLTELQYLHIVIRRRDEYEDMEDLKTCHILFNQLLFNEKQISSIHTIDYKIYNGLLLNKSLKSHDNLRSVNLVLQTIDDLYILLNGLVPNVQMMIIKLCRSTIDSFHYPQYVRCTCPRLTDFTLFDSSSDFDVDDMKSILAYMTNLVILTLSIHFTFDPLFCHGPTIESILNEYLPHLLQFHYTITHCIGQRILIENFVQWPMNVKYYHVEHLKWVHIYSLPWPANKNDKRQFPFKGAGLKPSVSSDVKRSAFRKYAIITDCNKFRCLNTEFDHVCEVISSVSIDIKLPFNIYKVVFSSDTPPFPIGAIIQSSVYHLIVERYLLDDYEMLRLAHQFPHVKYLNLILPSNKHSLINCLNIFRDRKDNIKKTSCYWTKLICFSTKLDSMHRANIASDSQLYDWLNQYTTSKDQKNFIKYVNPSPNLTIWY
ncbi:unnamed protein product [Rotaria sordida]|uniref:F-box domain-containing protein n=1 Tax=Rotaria sordida TaxID=392033 RepID=A0A814UL27_9BILA|nr:unnamed protein product [Rotaria sordida]CAF1438151.1 unnamed protein product [Rotaria sordida]